MRVLDNIFNNRTNYKAGGLMIEDIPASAVVMKTPDKFISPRKLDFRDMCIQTSDQQKTPHCTGYSTAGYIEVQNWRTLHYPEQVDGDAIYAEAKKIDGYNGDGSWIKFAVQGAMNLGLVKGTAEYVAPDRQQFKFAIHENCVCIAAFKITDEWNRAGYDGVIPNWGDKSSIIGGHAVLCCGFSDEGVYIQNSWGPRWGLYGFGLLSWEQFDRQFQNGMIIRR